MVIFHSYVSLPDGRGASLVHHQGMVVPFFLEAYAKLPKLKCLGRLCQLKSGSISSFRTGPGVLLSVLVGFCRLADC